jgi:hypothetical protein
LVTNLFRDTLPLTVDISITLSLLVGIEIDPSSRSLPSADPFFIFLGIIEFNVLSSGIIEGNCTFRVIAFPCSIDFDPIAEVEILVRIPPIGTTARARLLGNDLDIHCHIPPKVLSWHSWHQPDREYSLRDRASRNSTAGPPQPRGGLMQRSLFVAGSRSIKARSTSSMMFFSDSSMPI